MTTVKSTVGPSAAATGPTANGVADRKLYRPAASGAAVVPAIGTAVYSSGVPDTKNANGSLISTGVGGPPAPVVNSSVAACTVVVNVVANVVKMGSTSCEGKV